MMPYGIAPGETVGPTVNMWDEMRKSLDMGSIDDMKRMRKLLPWILK